ncbi:YidC/Oxa1 family membrane protein insertase [Micromonospora thermarum]|uniref:Membrane protein insertase YidC n=1 Tax=Micromonospora thermarum TaxID=2720024 RepID=A0ABX0Z7W4_9ACTN|nr:membrane protein insertase YidC [Micromonospora thermarum]NJP32211.1 membrane protein insertase YidC [Micromonospora thermarum]
MYAFAPLSDVVGAAGTVLAGLAGLLEPLTGGAATAAAIVVFTVAVRLLISPLTVAQVRGERRRAALAPRVRELQRRYADEPARLQAELLVLYRSAGAGPLTGCLPLLLQAPFLLVAYRLFTTDEGGTGLLDERLAGVPLGHQLGDGLGGAVVPLFGVLLVALLVLAWWTSRRMRRGAPPAAAGTPGGETLARLLPLLPYTTVLVALVLPLAAVIYLATTTAWSGLEQAVLRRPSAGARI